MARFIVVALGLALAACSKPQELEPLMHLILDTGVPGVTPHAVCEQLGVTTCKQPTRVKSIAVIIGSQAKFAQVYLDSPSDLSIGIRHQDDATVFLSDAAGVMHGALKLDFRSSYRHPPADQAQAEFDAEKKFWIQWLVTREPKAKDALH